MQILLYNITMKSDDLFPLLVIVGIIVMTLLGGSKNMHPLFAPAPLTPEQQQEQKQAAIQQQISEAQTKVTQLQAEIKAQEDAKTHSVFYGKVTLQYVSQSTTPSREYIRLAMDSAATTTIPITGWTVRSLSTGVSVTIPKGTYLVFPATTNSEDSINLTGGDVVTLITGTSPNGYSFKVNKCSGYMTQFQDYTPYLSTNCPAPRNEDLSSIPNRVENDACFDYINAFPSCRTQTDPLPLSYSYECKRFITEKINYGSCVNTHKQDADFYQHDWRVYLGRSASLWKTQREDIVLYDWTGKIVSELKY